MNELYAVNVLQSIFPLSHGLMVAAVLFAIGLFGVMSRRNLLFMLIGLELMMNAAGLAFVFVGSALGQPDGQVMLIFILTLAAAEVAIGLALLITYYQKYKTLDIDQAKEMNG